MSIGSYRSRHESDHRSKQFHNRSMAEHEMLDTALRKAWDQLCDQSSWRYWHSRMLDDLQSEDSFYLMLLSDSRDDVRFRTTRDGLTTYIPIKALRTL